MLGQKVHLSTLCLVTIGLFDLVTTLMLLRQGTVAESNPLFAPLLRYGAPGLILGKLVFLVGPVLILEFARTKHPKTAEQATWVAFVAYALLYGSHLIRLS